MYDRTEHESVILWTRNCPMCKVLESKLKQKNIDFETIDDMEVMKELGFKSMPMLDVDGIIMNYKEALKWVNER